jgi:hypothetical protein
MLRRKLTQFQGGVIGCFPACVAQVSPPERIGSRLGFVLFVMSFSTLTGPPLAGGKYSHGARMDCGSLLTQFYLNTASPRTFSSPMASSVVELCLLEHSSSCWLSFRLIIRYLKLCNRLGHCTWTSHRQCHASNALNATPLYSSLFNNKMECFNCYDIEYLL